MISRLLCVALVLACNPGTTHAEAVAPSEALSPKDEKTFRREGFAIGVGIGPALFLGNESQSDARGSGGSFSLRFGTTAGKKLLWFAQFDSSPRNETSGILGLSVGAHYYMRDALWVRGGPGLATFYRRAEDPFANGEETTKSALAITGGVGIDVYRRGIFAVDLELSGLRAKFEGGAVTVSALLLAVNWY